MLNTTLVIFGLIILLSAAAYYYFYYSKETQKDFSESLLNSESKVIIELVDHIKHLKRKVSELENNLSQDKKVNEQNHKLQMRSLGILNDSRNLDNSHVANIQSQLTTS
tara:strand:+ start:411 stop:737 length:327 start_codon:yes stop_codon:yes gene_type:complete